MVRQDPKNSIAGWFFTYEEIACTLSDGLMINPSIDLSNPCNLNCPYCYIEEKNSTRKLRKPNELTFEETVSVIDDFYSCGAKTINIVGAGEPTIDPHFDSTIKFIAERGMSTVLFTNGIQFVNHPESLKFLYENNVSIVLKYNSNSSEVQDLVAGRRGYSQKRDMALEYLIDTGFTAHEPTRLGLDIIVFKGNVEEVKEIHRWCRTQNIFPIAGEFIPTGRTENGDFQGYKALEGFSENEREQIIRLLQPINHAQRTGLLKDLESIDKGFGIERPKEFAYFGGGICTQILGLYVDIEGNIWPCVARKQKSKNGFSDGLLGNVRNGDKSSQIWRDNYYMKQIRKSFSGGCPYKPLLSPLGEPHEQRERKLHCQTQ